MSTSEARDGGETLRSPVLGVAPEGKGFFALEGHGWRLVITQLKLYLGRQTPDNPVDIALGTNPLISRFL